MKKVMLIGNPSDYLKKLGEYLSARYSVNTVGFDPEVVYEILGVFSPDAIVISLEGAHESVKAVLRYINTRYLSKPVITLGTAAEKTGFAQYYKENQFENIERPAELDDIAEAIERRLSEGAEYKTTAKKYIMVIDDDMSFLKSVKAMLEDEYEVAVAPSGMAALKMMNTRLPDLVLLDYDMPHCDGRETLEMIRTITVTKDMPVVFLTCITDREHIDAILGLNPQGYIVKPVDPASLKEAVEKVLFYL